MCLDNRRSGFFLKDVVTMISAAGLSCYETWPLYCGILKLDTMDTKLHVYWLTTCEWHIVN